MNSLYDLCPTAQENKSEDGDMELSAWVVSNQVSTVELSKYQ